jgi:signal transduction histidine kinase
MTLSEFIKTNRKTIIAEWDSFARSCAPASGSMDITALADHASEMLTVIAKDLNTAQDAVEQSNKSKGLGPALDATHPTAASEHGASRAESGFTVEQMVAEFRALRASVIRLWIANQGTLDAANIDELTRFNEAVDQALAESVARYTQDLDHSKEMFLAILGHDLRSPLGAVMMSAEFMLETGELLEPHLTLTKRIGSSAKRMQHMIGDLLDFTRSRLGGGIPITRADMSMEKAVHDVVDEVAAANPGRKINVDARGGQRGEWDCQRIGQALTNLLGNALEHGTANGEVTVKLDGDDNEARISVHNYGTAISPEQLNGIFGSMKGSSQTDTAGSYGNLGLGLYIAERIVHAHDGTIEVKSSNELGTTFTIRLPRHAA